MPLRMANGDYSTNMAAPYVTALRTALKGVHFVPALWLLTHRSGTPAVCQCFRLHAARCRPLHVSSTASQCSSRTETQRTAASHTDDRRGRREEEEEEEEEEEPEGPEYIPKEKAKNPMMLIGYAWIIGLPAGIISFLLAKRQVDKNRLKQLKVRQRMRKSNEGDYEGSRYHHPAEDVKLDH